MFNTIGNTIGQGVNGLIGSAVSSLGGGVSQGAIGGGSNMAGGIKIQIEYEGMDQISSMLSKMGDNLAQTIQKIDSHVQQLQGGGWKGAGAEAFYDEMQTVKQQLQKLQQDYEQQNSKIKETSQKYQEAEQQMIAFFGSL
jgi:WXG100 family type VII secretion target